VYRRRIASEAEHLIEGWGLTHAQLARRIVEDDIDILIDLMGYTVGSCPEVSAARPARLQASYLYPGTLGAEFVDYFFTDALATPAGHARYFQEQLVHLPDTY
jgi:predicted O-linked N-acetylglucosamine transferase (SPINDLY family)